MAYFASVAVIVLSQNRISRTWRQALLAGLLTGGVAGAKYTGCLVALGIVVAISIEYRSVVSTSLLCVGSLLTGIWPYLRNLFWTGDPLFPFLTKTLFPERVNLFALNALLATTGAAQSRHFGQLLPFIFFAGVRQGSLGFWDFFGPIVYALAPLWIFAFGNFHKWRTPAIVWCFSAIGVFYFSGLPRYLLPVFPLALACITAGIDWSQQRGWKIANRFATSSVIVLWIAGGAGLLMYSWKPVATAVGMVPEVTYLEERRPEYQEAEVINRVLDGQTNGGKTLLFARHLYSVGVPYINGDPSTSWTVNPDRLRSPRDWEDFFQQEGIAFVVRSPEYPEAIEVPLTEMEENGDLVRVARLVVQDFQGLRIEGKRRDVPVFIFKVKSWFGP